MTRYLPTRRAPDDRLLMFCFPYAGGGASAYAGWQRRLGDRVEVLPVQLPGREGRSLDPRFTHLPLLIEDLDRELGPELERPHVLFGHSMGALIAFSLAEYREERGERLPEALILSAYRAPHLPPPRLAPPDASDDELVASLVGLGGIPQVLLDHPEWLSALLPIARDDLRLCSGPGPTRRDPLPVPIQAYAGRDDSLVTPAEVAEWVGYASAGFAMRTLPGGHFFLRENEDLFLPDLAHSLTHLLAAAAR
ncbi:thioesterase II family protein [Streptacidiphilus rugosus]|uniref:thioesterase II family protein n=1 Tax=Streptacidiphilus rugosus TaxID=405783 RepID=UPI000AC07A32|nr:alpha/beta fold hydrolase [Streptacidiphilus rugosus]